MWCNTRPATAPTPPRRAASRAALHSVENRSPRRTRSFGFYAVFSVVNFHPYGWAAGPCDAQDDILAFMNNSFVNRFQRLGLLLPEGRDQDQIGRANA